MRAWKSWIALFLLSFTSLCYAATSDGKAIVLDVNDAIGPATQDYIKRGLTKAVEQHATIVVLQLNTPGGLETAMRSITEAIVASPIPVVVYVAPTGARAASAGTYLLYSAHVAAMAPGTNVGAATPISLTDKPQNESAKQPSTEMKKATNDASAYLLSLAELRGRNADWTKQAVKNAASISANEAKKLKVVNVIADTIPDLLQKINGYVVTVNHTKVTLNTKNLTIETVAPDWRNKFLSFITDPNIAYLLMLLAVYGIFFELANPGLVLPGVAGVIALLIVFYAFQLLPVNYTGLALIAVGIIFILLELFVASYGALGIGGAIAFIIGSIMLFDMNSPEYHVMTPLIITMSIISLVFFFGILMLAIRSHKRAIVTGKEGLIGAEGVILSIMNQQIVVRVLGEIWEARSLTLLNPGDKVRVTKVTGLILSVEPVNKY